MAEFKLSIHQIIARELFGESTETYEMERADLYQRLSRIMVGYTTELTDEALSRAYKLGYRAQIADGVAGNNEFLDAFTSTVRLIRSE